MLVISLGTSLGVLFFVSVVLGIVVWTDFPLWLILGNLFLFMCSVHIVYKAVTVWPEESERVKEERV